MANSFLYEDIVAPGYSLFAVFLFLSHAFFLRKLATKYHRRVFAFAFVGLWIFYSVATLHVLRKGHFAVIILTAIARTLALGFAHWIYPAQVLFYTVLSFFISWLFAYSPYLKYRGFFNWYFEFLEVLILLPFPWYCLMGYFALWNIGLKFYPSRCSHPIVALKVFHVSFFSSTRKEHAEIASRVASFSRPWWSLLVVNDSGYFFHPVSWLDSDAFFKPISWVSNNTLDLTEFWERSEAITHKMRWHTIRFMILSMCQFVSILWIQWMLSCMQVRFADSFADGLFWAHVLFALFHVSVRFFLLLLP